MHRKISIRVLTIFIALLASHAEAAGNDRSHLSATPIDVSNWMDDLGSADFKVYEAARDRLQNLGESARAALIEASYSDNAQIALRAGELLLKLQWIFPNDTPEVKQLLSNYGEMPAEMRSAAVLRMWQLPNMTGREAAIRILKEDPSGAVRWAAATVLHSERDDYRPPWPTFRALLSDASPGELKWIEKNSALLAVAGWAWRETDINRAEELLLKSVAVETGKPSAMPGQMDFVYFWLVERSNANKHYEASLKLLRQQAATTPWNEEDPPITVMSLFSLHADHGPFPGFAVDLRNYRAYLTQPEMIYMLGRVVNRQGWTMTSTLLEASALALSGVSADRHYAVASYLATQGWSDEATRELNATLWLSGGQSINVYFQLARIASDQNDDLATAQNLEKALKAMASASTLVRRTRFGDEFAWSENDAWAEVHWHYLRAARAANDMAGVQMRLGKLMELNELSQIFQKDSNFATDIVPALDDAGRKEEADKCFEAAYADLKKTVDSVAGVEAKNNLAWLCARCGRKLDEAVKLSSEAVAGAPLNSAYLDTAAEANFRQGKVDEAIKLESQALDLKPGDVFMKQQLERFRKK